MDYSRIDFSQIPVEQVICDAANDLYQAAHKARSEAHLRLKNPPSSVSSEEFEDQVAEAVFGEMLGLRGAYVVLFSCVNQLRSHVPWARATGSGAFRWSKTGRDAFIAMGNIQSAYSKVQDAALLLPGSEGQDRAGYLSLIADPNNAIEREMVDALLVIKSLR